MNEDLINALKALGYKATEAKALAKNAISRLGPKATLGTLVKEALKKPERETHEEELEPPEELETLEEEEIPVSRCRSLSRRTGKAAKFHFLYCLLLGWWLTLVYLLIQLILMGIEAVFRRETKRYLSVPALFGWW